MRRIVYCCSEAKTTCGCCRPIRDDDAARAAQAYETYLLLAPNYTDSAEVRKRIQAIRPAPAAHSRNAGLRSSNHASTRIAPGSSSFTIRLQLDSCLVLSLSKCW